MLFVLLVTDDYMLALFWRYAELILSAKLVLCCLCYLATQIHELSVAASGYHQAIKENRNLYNILQELKGRFPPFAQIEWIKSDI